MLTAVQTHLKFKYREKATITHSPDFGGLFNPLAEVIMTSTREGKDETVKWMKDYASRRRMTLSVSEDALKAQSPEPQPCV